jgi:hypothetical protein
MQGEEIQKKRIEKMKQLQVYKEDLANRILSEQAEHRLKLS